MWPGSGYEGWFLVEGAVFGHAVDHVASAAGEADDGGVVVFALFAFALVVGDRGRVFGGRDERGLPQRVPEAFVAPSGGSLALDAGAGLAGGRSDAGVGGQVGRAFEVGDVAADAERDAACGPDAYPGHRHRDREKRVVLQELLDLAPDLAPPVLDGLDVAGDRGDDGLGHAGAGHGDGLLADGLEHVVDDAAGAKPVGPGPVLHVLDPDPFHARGAAVPFEQRERRVAGGAFPFQDAFERGVGLQEQAPQAVDVARGFVGEVLVVAGEHSQCGEGLVVASRVPERLGQFERGPRDHMRVPAIGLRVPGQQLRGPAHGRAGQVGDRDPHVPRHRQGQGAYGVGLVHDQQHTAMLGELAQHRADGLLVLSHRLVVQGVAVPVEGVRVVRALAHVQAGPHVDVVRGHHRSSRHEGLSGRRGLGGVRTSGTAPTLRRDLRHAPLKRPCSRPGSYQRSSGVPAPGDNTPPRIINDRADFSGGCNTCVFCRS